MSNNIYQPKPRQPTTARKGNMMTAIYYILVIITMNGQISYGPRFPVPNIVVRGVGEQIAEANCMNAAATIYSDPHISSVTCQPMYR
jgi:hypothetical protein